MSLYAGHDDSALELIEWVIAQSHGLTYVQLGAIDTLAQITLRAGKENECLKLFARCQEIIDADSLPARSWYDLAHQQTRCTFHELRGEWRAVIDTAEAADGELARRQFKVVRTALLSAKARALAHLGRFDDAERTLAVAVRTCPRGAFDPLIGLEAAKAVCAMRRGDAETGATYFDRAVAAARAIGHRYHEWWIERAREAASAAVRTATPPRRARDVTDTALLLSDVATILGAGHSIDLLVHRTRAVIESTPMAARLTVQSENGLPFEPTPTASADLGPDHVFQIRLRGSDRRFLLKVEGVQSIAEISLLKSLSDLVTAAVSRTTDAATDDEEQNLWPRSLIQAGEHTVFRSPRMVELLRIAARLADTDLPVLITGETGTGKEVLARIIHDHSRVRRGPFVAFNCSALPRDLVESQLFGHRRGAFTGAVEAFDGVVRAAEGGTLFLDEIGDLDVAIQPKLLRFLESGEFLPVGEARARRVNVRLVAATNAPLDVRVSQGQFRSDLLYRIDVARLALPPLRERKDEIPALAALFVTGFSRDCQRTGIRIGDDLIAALLMYDWPGNIRQLSNELRRIVAMAADGQTLASGDLSPDVTQAWNARPTQPTQAAGPVVEVRLDQPLGQAVEELERHFIDRALQLSGGRVTEAAARLGLSRKGLFLKRRRQGLTGR